VTGNVTGNTFGEGENILKENSEEEKKRFREIIIPGDVLDDDRLSDGAKLMYGKIARLAFKTGECWASNSFLDGTKTGRNSSRCIAELKNTGYIVIENEGGKSRKIKIGPIQSRVNNSTSPNSAGLSDDNGNSTSPNMAGLPDDNGNSTSPNSAGLSDDNGNSTSPNMAGLGYLANSGEVEKSPTSPILAGSEPLPRQIRRGETSNLANSGEQTLEEVVEVTSSSAVPQELKNALAAVDPLLILSADFYPRAADFMAANGLDLSYLPWMYEQCKLQSPRSIRGLYYTLFFDDTMPEIYKASRHTNAPPPPPPDIPCPVCGTLHAQRDDNCPSCGLPKDVPEDRIQLLQALHTFPPEKRAEYIRREQILGDECGKDYIKYSSLLANLQKEFGLNLETA